MSSDEHLPYRDGPDDEPTGPPDVGADAPQVAVDIPAAELDALISALDRLADTEQRAYAAARVIERVLLEVRDPAIYTLVSVLRRSPPEVAHRLDLPISAVVWAAARTGRPSSRS